MSRLLMIVAIFSVHVAQRNVEKIVQHIDDDQRWRFHGTPLIPRFPCNRVPTSRRAC